MKMSLQERLEQLLEKKDVQEKDDLIALMLLDMQPLFDEVTEDNLVKITIDKNYTAKVEVGGVFTPEVIAHITMQLSESCYQLLGSIAQHAIPDDNTFKKLILSTYLQGWTHQIKNNDSEFFDE